MAYGDTFFIYGSSICSFPPQNYQEIVKDLADGGDRYWFASRQIEMILLVGDGEID
ncbi:MAG: hypothetical protein SAJ37_16245 [Oscillatoria sp. PMC 1068.18]|nr:hypothetical protein [Oscillatoria sp. PMC 1076.18]MEC4990282.1 hypothetical protein [Oscillatoria sp. PMC 1068.18]